MNTEHWIPGKSEKFPSSFLMPAYWFEKFPSSFLMPAYWFQPLGVFAITCTLRYNTFYVSLWQTQKKTTQQLYIHTHQYISIVPTSTYEIDTIIPLGYFVLSLGISWMFWRRVRASFSNVGCPEITNVLKLFCMLYGTRHDIHKNCGWRT